MEVSDLSPSLFAQLFARIARPLKKEIRVQCKAFPLAIVLLSCIDIVHLGLRVGRPSPQIAESGL